MIRIASNISSLQARRMLNRTSYALADSFERLGSGARINRAADDPAGLAVASTLKTNSRLFSQALRNVNDGISMLNVAEGALQELTNVTNRMLELSEQAANGTYSSRQRSALASEASALVSEYNRITATTSFNGVRMFNDGPTVDVSLQVGLGGSSGDTLRISLGKELTSSGQSAQTAGTGTFTVTRSINLGASPNPFWIESADLNKDSFADILVADSGLGGATDRIFYFLGNGDGTFRARRTLTTGADAHNTQVADLDKDGNLDVVSSDYASGTASIFYGNGDGTFWARTAYSLGPAPSDVKLGDINGDGWVDMVAPNDTLSTVTLVLNAGDGSFLAPTSYAVNGWEPYDVTLGDFDGDSDLDLAFAEYEAGSRTSVLLNNGNGTFRAPILNAPIDWAAIVSAADVTRDGRLDLLVSDGGTMYMMSGNGNGTFGTPTVVATNLYTPNSISDVDGDSILDLVGSDPYSSSLVFFKGNGDGTFRAAVSSSLPALGRSTAIADVNGDGVGEVLAITATQVIISTATTQVITSPVLSKTISPIDLSTQSSARTSIDTVKGIQDRVSREIGAISAIRSRLSSAKSTLEVNREQSIASMSRIVDLDIAEESARSVGLSIRQEVNSAILAQANQQPSIALTLLN